MLLIMNCIFRGKSHWKGFCCSVTTLDTGTLWAWQHTHHVPDRTLFSDQNTHGCTDGRNDIDNLLIMSRKSQLHESVNRNAALCVAHWPARMSNCRDSADLFGRTHLLNHTETLSMASFALMHIIAANSKRFFKSRLHTQSLRLPAREERKRIKMEKYWGDHKGNKKTQFGWN